MMMLTMREGDDLFIGGIEIVIGRIERDHVHMLIRDKRVLTRIRAPLVIDVDQDIEIVPLWDISEGGRSQSTFMIGVSAPRDIAILTGRNYRKQRVADAA